MPNSVSLVRVEDFDEECIKRAVYRAIDLIGFTMPSRSESAFIKPNLCYYWDYSTGETTDPRVVSAIIDYIRDKTPHRLDIKIVESDASAMNRS